MCCSNNFKWRFKDKKFQSKIIQTEINILKKLVLKLKHQNEIHIKDQKNIKNINSIITKEYPNFPTDLQAQFMVLLCKVKGRSSITESIFENRFMHVAEIKKTRS